MTSSSQTVAEQRDYDVLTVEDARDIATTWLENIELEEAIVFGVPEVDDRYHVWRVPLVGKDRPGAERGAVLCDEYLASSSASRAQERVVKKNRCSV